MPEYWREHLAESGLTAPDIKKLRLRWLSPRAVRSTLKAKFPLSCGGVHFPYWTIDGKIDPTICRVRLLSDPVNGHVENGLAKYLQPPGTPPKIYLPPLADWKTISQDATQPLLITEGEKKSAAVCKIGLPCIGLGGVWSFQQKDTGVPLLADLVTFNWVGRLVTLVYDSDWAENKDVRQAAGALARRLGECGAEVRAALLGSAPGGGKIGVDDLLVARGPKALHAAIDSAFALTPEMAATADYRARFVLVKSMSCAWDTKLGQFFARHKFEDGFPDDIVQTFNAAGRQTTITKAEHWWKDPNKRSAGKLVLEPDQPEITEGGDLNRFRGWGTEPKRGTTEVWQTLLKILFHNQKSMIPWFEKWCAFPIQHPGTKLHTSVFIYGGQGVGKTALGRILLDIYGKSGRTLEDRQVFGGFNGWIGETLFALGDDLAFGERRKSRSVIKMIVDSETIEVNEKYVPSYPVKNHCNFYFTANSPSAMPLDPSGINRRFLVVEAPTQRDRPETWYTETLDQWRKDGGSAHVHNRLRKLDLSGFHAHGDAPSSDAKHLVMETGRSGVEGWCAEITQITELAFGTARELHKLYQADTQDFRTGKGLLVASLRGVAYPFMLEIKGNPVKLWAIRDIEKWKKASAKARAEQYRKDRGIVS